MTPLVVLTWDTGSRTAVYGRTVFGRNPVGDGTALTMVVRDETLSLSKTHFEVGGDTETGAWVRDHASRNGTILVRAGRRFRLWPHEQTRVQVGDRFELGDRLVTVSGAP